MLAIMHALAKFKQYLVGARFVVKSHLNMEFVKGKNNVVADALSRRPSNYAMIDVYIDSKDHLVMEYSENQFACQVMDGQIQDDNFRVIDGLIYYKGRIFLVPESAFKAKVLQACHDSPMAGHQGIGKTYR
jgi:hypothetical protein